MDLCKKQLITHNIITQVEKRERLRTYEEGKILHNNSSILVPHLEDKKLLKNLLETIKKIKIMSKRKLESLEIEDN